jgi:hypothetical protein
MDTNRHEFSTDEDVRLRSSDSDIWGGLKAGRMLMRLAVEW